MNFRRLSVVKIIQDDPPLTPIIDRLIRLMIAQWTVKTPISQALTYHFSVFYEL